MLNGYEYEKFYMVRENKLSYLGNEHQDVVGLRTIAQLNNLSSSLRQLKVLHHPYLFSAFAKDQVPDLKALLSANQLEELSFEMKLECSEYSEVFELIRTRATALKKLQLTVATKPEIMDVLNKKITKESAFKSLIVNFVSHSSSTTPTPTDFQVKFHKYPKNLRTLALTNIGDKNFSETLFDMACIRRLRDLTLSFTPDLSLPNFTEALSKFS